MGLLGVWRLDERQSLSVLHYSALGEARGPRIHTR